MLTKITARLSKAKKVQAFIDVKNMRLGMSQSVLGLNPNELPIDKGLVRKKSNGSVLLVKIGSVGKPEHIELTPAEVVAIKKFI